MPLVSPLTIDDFERLPDELAHNHELVDGELVDVSGNTLDHNFVRDHLAAVLREFVRKNRLGEVVSDQEYDFGGNAHGSDISFFGPDKRRLCNGKLRVQRFVPDLAVEIVSQNDTFARLVEKAHRYRKYGTREVWIFSIESREAYVYSESGATFWMKMEGSNPA